MSANDPPPFFVPTLTEVVAAPAAAEPAPPVISLFAPETVANLPATSAAVALAATSSVTAEAVAAALLRRIGLELDRQIGETIARVLHDQMLGFNPRLHKAVADVVREAVIKSLAQEGMPDVGPGKKI